MEIGDSKMIVKQNMLFLVDNMKELSNFVMFNWMKNDITGENKSKCYKKHPQKTIVCRLVTK